MCLAPSARMASGDRPINEAGEDARSNHDFPIAREDRADVYCEVRAEGQDQRKRPASERVKKAERS